MAPNAIVDSPTAAVGSFAAKLLSQCLPQEIEAKLGELFLDYLRVASIGERMPWSAWAREYQRSLGGHGKSCVLYSEQKTNPVQASFLNATYAGSIDSDDTHVGSMLHPGAIVFSAALAIATDIGSSGRQFVSAVAAGYEAMIRIGLAIQPSHFRRGFQSTSTCGGFGAATAAAMLLSDEHDTARRISETLGIAASFAGGLTQFYQSGSTIKRIHAAHAAECGVSSALLALQGFSGPVDILEGANGFARAYADEAKFNLLTDGLGSDFRLMEVMVKGHACSARIQAAVEGVFELAKAEEFAPGDIEAIHVGIPSVIAGRLTLPDPVDLQAAQMSMPFSVALAVSKLRHSKPTVALEISDYESGLKDDDVRALQDLIHWEIDAEVEAATTTESVPAKVAIRLKGGREVAVFVLAPRGSPARPVTHEEQVQRFHIEVGRRLSYSACDSLVKFSQNLKSLDSIERVTALISGEA